MKKKVLRDGRMQVPAWMATFSITKHRYVPTRLRPAFQAANEWVGRKAIWLPQGFSHSGFAWYWPLSGAQHARQRRRMGNLSSVKARSPATWEALGHAFPAPVAVRAHFVGDRAARFWLLLADCKGPLAYLARTADFSLGTVEHAYMTRHPRRAGDGAGLSDQAMANASVVYPALGIHRIALTAGLSAGSAIWPRAGFCPVDLAEWDKLRKVVHANFLVLAPEVEEAFAHAHQRSLGAAISSIVANDDPAAVFEVVDIDPGSKVKNALQLKHGLGGLLLAGGHWRGHLELGSLGGKRLQAFIAAKRLTLPTV